MATASQTKPVFSTRHEHFDVAAWPKEHNDRTFYNVSLKHSYKDGEEWKHTKMDVGERQLLRARKLLDWADDQVQALYAEDTKFQGGKKPIASKRVGKIEVTIWQRDTDKGVRYRIGLARHYQQGSEWKRLVVFMNGAEALDAAHLLGRAYDALDRLRHAANSDFVKSATNTFGADIDSVDDSDEPPF